MPPAKLLPLRHCVVCTIEFQPKRSDQVFCGTERNYACWDKLRRAMENCAILYHRALAKQSYKCWDCGQSAVGGVDDPDGAASNSGVTGGSTGGSHTKVWESTRLLGVGKVKLAPLCRHPEKVGAGTPLRDGDIVASCTPCRKKFLHGLATKLAITTANE